MRTKNRSFSVAPPLITGLSVAVLLLLGTGAASAAPQYLDDGAVQSASGGWDMPQSSAGPGIGSCGVDPTKLTRPECEGLRLPAASSGACTALGGSWTTGSVCNDTVNTNQAACEAAEARLWNAASGICAVTMKGYNRNRAVCQNLGGTWAAGSPGTCRGSWVFPASSTFSPPVLTAAGTASGGPGDLCLRCHNGITEWNSTRIRDVEKFLMTGHKNISRKVTAGAPWAGADGAPYATDTSGAPIDWDHGTVGGDPAAWIYAGWQSPLPRAVKDVPGQSHSCGRCHMTGWVSNADPTMEPEASFPGIRTNVNVTGSWDLYGITCSRCHGSTVDGDAGGSCSVANLLDSASCAAGGGTWTAGNPLPAAFGRGATHHADVTNFDAVNGGYCTNLEVRNVNKLTCEYFGDTWYSACSDDRWYSATQCVANAGCINPGTGNALNYANESACEAGTAGECSIPVFTTSAPCTAGGGTWTPATNTWWTAKDRGTWSSSSCSIGGGTCSVAGNTTPAACKTAFGVWTPTWGNLFECMDAGGHWTGNKSRRGQLITSVCMDCHRQETGGVANENPADALKVGPNHSGMVEFLSYPQGNQFLNSPHGKFTGTFAQIGTATYGAGYGSYFQFLAEASGTGNGCTGCHNVHESTVEDTGHEHAIHAKCDSCHSKNLNNIRHPLGGGTPMEEMATHPEKACVTCHMPNGEHLFRVNTDPTYSTFPVGALTSSVNANSAPDENYTNAVWVDIDAACGQCHGGGTAGQAFAIGSTMAGTRTVALDSALGFAAGERIVIADAGALKADGVTRSDFESYIRSIDGNMLTLAGNVPATVTGSTVEQNPTASGGAFINKLQLAALAEDIHADEPLVSFGYTFGSPNTLTLNVDGSKSICAGTCDAFEWAWGDGTSSSGATASHTYAAAGTYSVTLTVEEHGVNSASKTRSIKLTAPDLRPTVAGTCTFDANTWTANVTDASMDDVGIKQVTVNWGDGSVLSNDTTAPFGPFSRTYKNAGSYTVRHRAIDTIGQARSQTCVANPAPFVISGTVYRSNGTTAVPTATVQVRQGGALRRTVFTASNGTFSVGNLKPGTYTLTLTKSGFTFGAPTSITVGPSSAGNVITATVP